MRLTSCSWEHTHPISSEFVDAWLRPNGEIVGTIRELTRTGMSAPEIRKKTGTTMPARKLYDIRRPILKEKSVSGWDELIQASGSMQQRWRIRLHYEGEKNEKGLMLITYVSRRFSTSAIARDIVQMDDIVGTNLSHLAIVNLVFQDENEKTQVLAFAVTRDRDAKSFTSVLSDVKEIVGCPRAILVDRLRAQIAAIEEVMPETRVIFCHVHLQRNILKVFQSKAQEVMCLFHEFVTGKISLAEYSSGMMAKAEGYHRHIDNLPGCSVAIGRFKVLQS